MSTVKSRPGQGGSPNDSHTSVAADLNVARALAKNGVPIFLGEPDASTKSGYRLPARWHRTVADPTVLDQWTPGMAVCAVMGHTFDGLDVDPRSGGDVSAEDLRSTGRYPKSYGRSETPSGGTHDYIAPLGVGSRDGVCPGVDLKGGKPDGNSHGFLFLPPTERVSKSDGEKRTYRWLAEPSFDTAEGDTSGAGIAALINELQGPTRVGAPVAPGATPNPGYVNAAVLEELEKLDALSTHPVPSWDAATFGAACNLIELSNGSQGVYSREQASADFFDRAPRDNGFGPREHTEKWRSAVKTSGEKARAVPSGPAEAESVAERPASTRERYPALDWQEVLSGDFSEPDWLCEPLIERGTSVAIYSAPKAGKSLLLQEVCAALATGRALLGNSARDPERVLYLDQENTRQDIGERLTAMGHVAEELENFIYLSFAGLPPLDTAAGAKELRSIVDEYQPTLVVLDTVSRYVAGDENEASTYSNLYRLSLAPLKAQCITVVRLDHAGKDASKGQRGSSAKSGDVDTVWSLHAEGDRVELTRDVTRNGHGVDRLVLTRETEPLRHVPRYGGDPFDRSYGDDVAEVIADLDKLGVPDNAGRPKAVDALTRAGLGKRVALIGEAVRVRKGRSELYRDHGNSSDDDLPY